MGQLAQRASRTRAQTALLESLEWLCGPLGTARVLEESLRRAGLRALPDDDESLLELARRHVVRMLHDALGPRDSADFVKHFLAVLEGLPEASAALSGLQRVAAPSSEREPAVAAARVVLVCSQRADRLFHARALTHAGYEVRVVERTIDLVDHEEPMPARALVDMSSRDVGVLLESMAVRRGDVRIVALARGDVDELLHAEETILRAGIYRYEVHGIDTSPEAILEALERLARD